MTELNLSLETYELLVSGVRTQRQMLNDIILDHPEIELEFDALVAAQKQTASTLQLLKVSNLLPLLYLQNKFAKLSVKEVIGDSLNNESTIVDKSDPARDAIIDSFLRLNDSNRSMDSIYDYQDDPPIQLKAKPTRSAIVVVRSMPSSPRVTLRPTPSISSHDFTIKTEKPVYKKLMSLRVAIDRLVECGPNHAEFIQDLFTEAITEQSSLPHPLLVSMYKSGLLERSAFISGIALFFKNAEKLNNTYRTMYAGLGMALAFLVDEGVIEDIDLSKLCCVLSEVSRKSLLKHVEKRKRTK